MSLLFHEFLSLDVRHGTLLQDLVLEVGHRRVRLIQLDLLQDQLLLCGKPEPLLDCVVFKDLESLEGEVLLLTLLMKVLLILSQLNVFLSIPLSSDDCLTAHLVLLIKFCEVGLNFLLFFILFLSIKLLLFIFFLF